MGGELSGANRTKLDAIFRKHGGVITPVRGTGEIRYRHPSFPHPVTVSAGRKDAPPHLAMLVGRLTH